MSTTGSGFRRRIQASFRSLSRLIPLPERARAGVRARVFRLLPWLFPDRVRPGQPSFSVAPLPSTEGVADYFIWGLLDWHFRLQRPQQLALALAESGRRVFFISSTLVDSAAPGFRVEALDSIGRLFQIFLHVRNPPSIYFSLPSAEATGQLRASSGALLEWSRPSNPICLVEHPFWRDIARTFPASRLIYDRMDYHAGFGTFAADLAAAEHDLMSEADLTVVSSDWLDRDTAHFTARRVLIRNATDYAHFAVPPKVVYRDQGRRRIIGYYGAIAGWMDLDLIASVADRYPDCLILLIGHDQVNAARRLGRLPNVRLMGEVPYAKLPFYLYGFDVCLLPRRNLPLTQAMNPVKVYEYLSAGRPVVAIDLPELRQFGDLVYCANSQPEFLGAIATALAESSTDPIIARRQTFAASQTWKRRCTDLMTAAESLPIPDQLWQQSY